MKILRSIAGRLFGLGPGGVVLGGGPKYLAAATASSAAATCNAQHCLITTEALTTAAGSQYTLVLTNNVAETTDVVHASVGFGTATTGEPVVDRVKVTANGSVSVVIENRHASVALDGTLLIGVSLFKSAA